MPISNENDITEAFPIFGKPEADAISISFQNLASTILNSAPNNRIRATMLGELSRSARAIPAMMEQESMTRDRELAQAKLAELFPDGNIPGEPSDDPIIQMANALKALKV